MYYGNISSLGIHVYLCTLCRYSTCNIIWATVSTFIQDRTSFKPEKHCGFVTVLKNYMLGVQNYSLNHQCIVTGSNQGGILYQESNSNLCHCIQLSTGGKKQIIFSTGFFFLFLLLRLSQWTSSWKACEWFLKYQTVTPNKSLTTLLMWAVASDRPVAERARHTRKGQLMMNMNECTICSGQNIIHALLNVIRCVSH